MKGGSSVAFETIPVRHPPPAKNTGDPNPARCKKLLRETGKIIKENICNVSLSFRHLTRLESANSLQNCRKYASIYGPLMPHNPFGINTQLGLLRPAHFHSLTLSFPYSCFISFPRARWPRPTSSSSMSTLHVHCAPLTVHHSPFTVHRTWVTSPLQIYLARSVFGRERNLNPARREICAGPIEPARGAGIRSKEEPCETIRSCCCIHHGCSNGRSGYCKGRNEDGGFWYDAGRSFRPDLHADQRAD